MPYQTRVSNTCREERILQNAHQSRQWQPISKASHWRLEITTLEILVNPLSLHRCIHIRPNQRNSAPRNTSSLITDLDCNILLAFDDDDLDRWQELLLLWAIALDDRTEGVLEKFETDVGEMARDVGEVEVGWADELNRWAFKHGVVLLADETRIFDRFVDDIVDVLVKGGEICDIASSRLSAYRLCADYAHVVRMRL